MRPRIGATTEERHRLCGSNWRRTPTPRSKSTAGCGNGGARCEDQRLHHEPGHPPTRVDLQAKTLGAAERDEEARARWRERVSRGSTLAA